MFSFIGNHNAPVCKHYFGLDQVINAQSVQTAKEAKTSEEHDSGTSWVGRASRNRLLSCDITGEKSTHKGMWYGTALRPPAKDCASKGLAAQNWSTSFCLIPAPKVT